MRWARARSTEGRAREVERRRRRRVALNTIRRARVREGGKENWDACGGGGGDDALDVVVVVVCAPGACVSVGDGGGL
jgi:hypothetical protein